MVQKKVSSISKFSIFNQCIDTISNTSLDKSSSVRMSQSTLNVVNFDKVTSVYVLSGTSISTSGFRSNDALIVLNNDSNYIPS